MKRILDIALSGLALVVLAPMLLPVALILRFSGEGEVFFVQQRVGLNGRPFGLLKFATMLKDSPRLGTGTITLKDDPRVLPVGRWLRKSKVNELPQLWNVLRGDMSIIGPRPQTARCFAAFPPRCGKAIATVRPGLSGVGSIVFRDEERLMHASADPDHTYDAVIMPYKGQLEEWFVVHDSVWVYLKLIALTLWVLVGGSRGSPWRWLDGLPQPPSELASLR